MQNINKNRAENKGLVGKTQEKADLNHIEREKVKDRYGEPFEDEKYVMRGGFVGSGGENRGLFGDYDVSKSEKMQKAADRKGGNSQIPPENGSKNNLASVKNSLNSGMSAQNSTYGAGVREGIKGGDAYDREYARHVKPAEGENKKSEYGNFELDGETENYGNFEANNSDFVASSHQKSTVSDEEGDEDEEDVYSCTQNKKDPMCDRTVTVKSGEKLIKTIVIAGQIEGHSLLPQGQKATRYEELIPQLVEIEESDEIGGLLLILNTVGGDVEAGLALSEMIAGMKKPTASLVLGGGHSIGVPLAVSAKRSFIAPSATMTLHPVRITGMVLDAPQTYVYLSKMQERIVDFICKHSSMTHERFRELLLNRDEMSTDLGSVLDGHQAVSEGLIDSLGTLHDAIDFLKESYSEK